MSNPQWPLFQVNTGPGVDETTQQQFMAAVEPVRDAFLTKASYQSPPRIPNNRTVNRVTGTGIGINFGTAMQINLCTRDDSDDDSETTTTYVRSNTVVDVTQDDCDEITSEVEEMDSECTTDGAEPGSAVSSESSEGDDDDGDDDYRQASDESEESSDYTISSSSSDESSSWDSDD
jgi:hypothetical protein